MSAQHRSHRHNWPSLAFGLFVAFLLVLLLAGGASRADAPGQVAVRAAAAVALFLVALLAEKPREQAPWAAIYLLLAMAALVLVQLVPMPPDLWQSLPGRTLFSEATIGSQPNRPLSIQPNATINAAASLLVPAATLGLAAAMRRNEREFGLTALLGLVTASALIGLIQFSGTLLDNPLVNDPSGAISGLFANRNHFALLLAFGCLLAPAWALGAAKRPWRLAAAFGLIILFLLLILASGSRAGILAGAIGLVVGLMAVRRELSRILRRIPRWAQIAIGVIALGAIATFVLISVETGRAEAVNRALALDTSTDMRARALPTVVAMTETYFPFGAGFGSFPTAFRIHEPLELLKPTYFNHAHNDFLEIVIDGGVPAALLLLIALAWLAFASVRVWRRASSPEILLGRLGSGMLLLCLVSSIFDYPARTPTVMAFIALAAAWVSWASIPHPKAALPEG